MAYKPGRTSRPGATLRRARQLSGSAILLLDPSVKIARTASHQFTTQIVEVFPANGSVQVRAPRQTRLTPA